MQQGSLVLWGMHQDEDEDAYLYGEGLATFAEDPPATVPTESADHDMERASEEGEVDDGEDDEEDSVRLLLIL